VHLGLPGAEQQEGAPLGQPGDLSQGDLEQVERGGERLAVEVAARQHRAILAVGGE
jgi:hypothetical protein